MARFLEYFLAPILLLLNTEGIRIDDAGDSEDLIVGATGPARKATVVPPHASQYLALLEKEMNALNSTESPGANSSAGNRTNSSGNSSNGSSNGNTTASGNNTSSGNTTASPVDIAELAHIAADAKAKAEDAEADARQKKTEAAKASDAASKMAARAAETKSKAQADEVEAARLDALAKQRADAAAKAKVTADKDQEETVQANKKAVVAAVTQAEMSKEDAMQAMNAAKELTVKRKFAAEAAAEVAKADSDARVLDEEQMSAILKVKDAAMKETEVSLAKKKAAAEAKQAAVIAHNAESHVKAAENAKLQSEVKVMNAEAANDNEEASAAKREAITYAAEAKTAAVVARKQKAVAMAGEEKANRLGEFQSKAAQAKREAEADALEAALTLNSTKLKARVKTTVAKQAIDEADTKVILAAQKTKIAKDAAVMNDATAHAVLSAHQALLSSEENVGSSAEKEDRVEAARAAVASALEAKDESAKVKAEREAAQQDIDEKVAKSNAVRAAMKASEAGVAKMKAASEASEAYAAEKKADVTLAELTSSRLKAEADAGIADKDKKLAEADVVRAKRQEDLANSVVAAVGDGQNAVRTKLAQSKVAAAVTSEKRAKAVAVAAEASEQKSAEEALQLKSQEHEARGAARKAKATAESADRRAACDGDMQERFASAKQQALEELRVAVSGKATATLAAQQEARLVKAGKKEEEASSATAAAIRASNAAKEAQQVAQVAEAKVLRDEFKSSNEVLHAEILEVRQEMQDTERDLGGLVEQLRSKLDLGRAESWTSESKKHSERVAASLVGLRQAEPVGGAASLVGLSPTAAAATAGSNLGGS